MSVAKSERRKSPESLRKGAARRVLLIALLLGLCADISTILFLTWRRSEDLHRATLLSENTAGLLAAQTERTMRALSVVNRNVVDYMSNRGVRDAVALDKVVTEWPTHEHLATLQALAGPLQAVLIIDRHGTLIAGSREWPTRRRAVLDRTYFQAFLRDAGRDYYVAEPMRNRRDGAWMVPVAFRLPLANEPFGGIVLCAVPLDFLGNILRSLDLGPSSNASVIRGDGTILASSDPRILGSGASDLDTVRLLQIAKKPSSTQLVTPREIVSIREVRPWPLFVRVALPISAVLAPWQREVWASIIGSILLNASLALASYLGLQQIWASHRVAERERASARRDPLTGLPNRIAFQDELANMFQGATSGTQFSLLLLDVDRFKAINDTLGHHAGDKLLVEIACRLNRARGKETFLSRLGGDEFAVVCKGGDEEQLAEALIREVATPMMLAGRQVIPGISIGSATAPLDGDNSELLLDNADLALYRAKAQGRGTHHVFSASIRAAEVAKLDLVHALGEAISENRLSIMYQPVSCLREQRVVAFEALARWDDPERGRIAPSTFIPIAEECGLISQLGRFVLQEALTCH